MIAIYQAVKLLVWVVPQLYNVPILFQLNIACKTLQVILVYGMCRTLKGAIVLSLHNALIWWDKLIINVK